MDEAHQSQPSHLFTVRIWPDRAEQPTTRWRGKVQHVQSGAWRHFRDWDDLVCFLQSQMIQPKAE